MVKLRLSSSKQVEVPLTTTVEDLYSKYLDGADQKNYIVEWNGLALNSNHKCSRIEIMERDFELELYVLASREKEVSSCGVGYKNIFFPKAKAIVQLKRTLRVPDNGKTYPLPPDLGTMEIYHNAKNEYTVPIYQREALWMNFSAERNVAIKIGIGSVNAITGEPWDKDIGVLKQNPQNYVVCPHQAWLDGINSSKIEDDGYEFKHTVRQFVAMPLNSKSLIESQLKELGIVDNVEGGLKFEASC